MLVYNNMAYIGYSTHLKSLHDTLQGEHDALVVKHDASFVALQNDITSAVAGSKAETDASLSYVMNWITENTDNLSGQIDDKINEKITTALVDEYVTRLDASDSELNQSIAQAVLDKENQVSQLNNNDSEISSALSQIKSYLEKLSATYYLEENGVQVTFDAGAVQMSLDNIVSAASAEGGDVGDVGGGDVNGGQGGSTGESFTYAGTVPQYVADTQGADGSVVNSAMYVNQYDTNIVTINKVPDGWDMIYNEDTYRLTGNDSNGYSIFTTEGKEIVVKGNYGLEVHSTSGSAIIVGETYTYQA